MSTSPKSQSAFPVSRARTLQSNQQQPEAKCTSDAVKRCSLDPALLGRSPSSQDMFHSLQGMMSALESENRQLKERIGQMARDVCVSPLSEDVISRAAIGPTPCVIEPQKDAMSE